MGDKKKELVERLIFGKGSNDLIATLKQEQLPLILWGAGDVAKVVIQHLEQNGISIAMAWVDGLEKEFKLGNILVTNLEQIKNVFPHFSVILGHSNYDLGDALLQRDPQVQKVYYFTSIAYEQYHNIKEDFVKEHLEDYYETYRQLEDEESRLAMVAYLNARMNNDFRYVKECVKHEQNYFNNDIFHIHERERYVDVGAFNGDSIRLFLQECNNHYDSIFAFEPEEENFLKLEKYVQEEGLANAELFPIGTWNQKDTLYFAKKAGQASTVSTAEEAITISVDTLDHILGDEKITLLKINFLHGVLETLMGAEKLLKRNHPRLALVVGFDEWGLIRIPQYIKKIVPQYQLYLRYNRCMPACLTLYVQAKDEGGNKDA